MARGTYLEHFFYAGGSISTSAPSPSTAPPWRITDTSSAGSPTYTVGFDNGTSAGIGHFARLGFSNTNEIQNVCLSWGDVLTFNIDDLPVIDILIRLGQSALDTTTSLVFGVAGDRNDTLDNVAAHVWFRMEGGTSTTAVYYESDDGTTDTDDQPTGLTLTTGWKRARLDFSRGKDRIQPYLTDSNGILKASPTTLNMSAYAGCFQPYFQIQKTADTNTDYMDVCMFKMTFNEVA